MLARKKLKSRTFENVWYLWLSITRKKVERINRGLTKGQIMIKPVVKNAIP